MCTSTSTYIDCFINIFVKQNNLSSFCDLNIQNVIKHWFAYVLSFKCACWDISPFKLCSYRKCMGAQS